MSDTVYPRDLFGFDACDDSQPFIFVSYAHADAERIAPYVSFLNENGIRVWYDNGLRPGQKWLEMLLTRISLPTCMAVMFFLSADSVSSPFVRAETEQAFKTKKPIYGVFLEDGLSLDVEMNAYISRIQSTFIPRHTSVSTAQNEILVAAAELLRGEAPGIIGAGAAAERYEDDLRKAELFLNHTRYDGTHDRVGEAQEIFRDLSQQNMTDPRGWFGLFRCDCLQEPETPEAAVEQLKAALDHYSYVINCSDSPEIRETCTKSLDDLWSRTLDLFDDVARGYDPKTSEEARALIARLPDSRMLRHVSPATTARYTDTADRLKTLVDRLEKEEEQRRLAQIEEEKQRRLKKQQLEALQKEKEKQKRQAELEAAEALRRETAKKQKNGLARRIVLCSLIALYTVVVFILIASQQFAWTLFKVIDTVVMIVLLTVQLYSAATGFLSAGYSKNPSPQKHAVMSYICAVSTFLLLLSPICLALNTQRIEIDGVYYEIYTSGNSTCHFYPVYNSDTAITVKDRVLGTDVVAPTGRSSDGLLMIHAEPNSKRFSSVDGVLFSKDQNTLVAFPAGRSGEYTIPQGTLEIGERAFSDCYRLNRIVIPDSVVSINSMAFLSCTRLTSIDIPDSVTEIGSYAFSECTNLTSVTLPDSVTSIGYGVFEDCTGLISVDLPDSVTFMGNFNFENCIMLESVSLPEGLTEVPYSSFRGCSKLSSIVLPKDIQRVGSSAFIDCSNLKEVIIPDGTLYIDDSAFSSCNQLERITIPDSVISIEYNAFEGCPNLKIVCSEGSYAHRYCLDHNIPCSVS